MDKWTENEIKAETRGTWIKTRSEAENEIKIKNDENNKKPVMETEKIRKQKWVSVPRKQHMKK